MYCLNLASVQRHKMHLPSECTIMEITWEHFVHILNFLHNSGVNVIVYRLQFSFKAPKRAEKVSSCHLHFVLLMAGVNLMVWSALLTMYSRSMKGSLMATISTFLEVKAARVTRRPMRPNLKSGQCSFLVWPLDGGVTPCWSVDHSHVWNNQSWMYRIMFDTSTPAWPTFWCCWGFLPLCEINKSPGDLKQPTEGQGSGGGAEGGVCCLTHSPLRGLKSNWTSNVVILVTAVRCLIKRLSYFLTESPKSWHRHTLFSDSGGGGGGRGGAGR